VIPVAFAVQQFCEGLVWVGLGHSHAALVQGASVPFLFFALVYWPLWVPLSIWAVEPRRHVRLGLGLLTAANLVWLWLFAPILLDPDRWLQVEVVGHSIHYEFSDIPGFQKVPRALWRLGYLLAICVPLLVWSRDRKGNILGGVAVAASFAVSYFVFWYAFTSVWCFFAAFLALGLCGVFHQMPEAQTTSPGLVEKPGLASPQVESSLQAGTASLQELVSSSEPPRQSAS
jgi:hypothetical protein